MILAFFACLLLLFLFLIFFFLLLFLFFLSLFVLFFFFFFLLVLLLFVNVDFLLLSRKQKSGYNKSHTRQWLGKQKNNWVKQNIRQVPGRLNFHEVG